MNLYRVTFSGNGCPYYVVAGNATLAIRALQDKLNLKEENIVEIKHLTDYNGGILVL